MVAAFLFHLLSAFMTFGATDGMSTKTAFVYLWSGTFLFAVANGTLEAVANPLVATLFPKNRTHYLNILHASWPAGMVIGGFIHIGPADVSWKNKARLLPDSPLFTACCSRPAVPQVRGIGPGTQARRDARDVGILGSAVIGLFIFPICEGRPRTPAGRLHGQQCLLPRRRVALRLRRRRCRGLPRIRRHQPVVDRRSALFVLFVTHTLVGAVELGTDGWIQNIEDAILAG